MATLSTQTALLSTQVAELVTFMLETGLRLDELLYEHFSDREPHVHVRGKFSKERDVPLTKKARKALDQSYRFN